MPKQYIALLLLFFPLGTLSGCDLGNLTMIVQFSRVDNLVTGDRVLNRQGYIGDVEKITRKGDGHYLVELDIDSNYKDRLTVYSIFYIDADHDRPGQQAVFTEQTTPGGQPLTDNSVIAGLDHPPYFRHMLDDLNRMTGELAGMLAEKIGRSREEYAEQSSELAMQLEEALTEIEKKLEELEKAVRTAPDSEEARELQRSLDKLVRELEVNLQQAKTMIGRDLFNTLHESLANLRHRLGELHRRDRLTPPSQGEKKEGGENI